MSFSKLIESKNNYKSISNVNEIFENLFKGACVKIKNSQKTFQVIGINPKNKVCWIREWPFSSEAKKTFALEISQIKIKTFCPNQFLQIN